VKERERERERERKEKERDNENVNERIRYFVVGVLVFEVWVDDLRRKDV
jgi:hypothetical protein